MPCLHMFHPECCTEWLQENLTCPVCKLDLHPSHIHRKLRFRVEDIETMSLRELRYLCYYVGINPKQTIIEKGDLVEEVLKSRSITVVCPHRSILDKISVKEIKAIMKVLNIDTSACFERDDLIKKLIRMPSVELDSNLEYDAEK